MARWISSAAVLLCLSLIQATAGEPPPERTPVYLLDLRVHLGGSGRSAGDFPGIFAEINRIWLTQAAVCFRIEAVEHDVTLPDGLDLWFVASLEGYNGYFGGPHSIRVRDFPSLAPAGNPSADPAARTAAHELGHALGLNHRQDSNGNLMRSKAYGWALDREEIAAAREAAAAKGSAVSTDRECTPPPPAR